MRSLALIRSNLFRVRPGIACRYKSDDRVMQQVDPDDPRLQAELGKIQLSMMRKAEGVTRDRVAKYKRYRKTDIIVASICAGFALSIYAYTMFAIKQENFLDDFEVPNPIPEEKE